MPEQRPNFGGEIQAYKRPNSSLWWLKLFRRQKIGDQAKA
jgi:hypothetical protein